VLAKSSIAALKKRDKRANRNAEDRASSCKFFTTVLTVTIRLVQAVVMVGSDDLKIPASFCLFVVQPEELQKLSRACLSNQQHSLISCLRHEDVAHVFPINTWRVDNAKVLNNPSGLCTVVQTTHI